MLRKLFELIGLFCLILAIFGLVIGLFVIFIGNPFGG